MKPYSICTGPGKHPIRAHQSELTPKQVALDPHCSFSAFVEGLLRTLPASYASKINLSFGRRPNDRLQEKQRSSSPQARECSTETRQGLCLQSISFATSLCLMLGMGSGLVNFGGSSCRRSGPQQGDRNAGQDEPVRRSPR